MPSTLVSTEDCTALPRLELCWPKELPGRGTSTRIIASLVVGACYSAEGTLRAWSILTVTVSMVPRVSEG